MTKIAEAAQPITGRGVGYKLFAAKLIPDMGRKSMKTVYRFLKEERERGEIPWHWIVDETRGVERTKTWDDVEGFAGEMAKSYRRDFWNQIRVTYPSAGRIGPDFRPRPEHLRLLQDPKWDKLFDSGFHCDRARTVPLAMSAVFLEAKIALTLVQPEASANKVLRSNK